MSPLKVVFLFPQDPQRAEIIKSMATPELSIAWVDPSLPDQEFIQQCRDADAMAGFAGRITPQIARSLPRLKFIQVFSAGYDSLDIRGLGEMGIRVANNGGANSVSVSEHTIGLMLSVYRRLMDSWWSAKQRKWRQGLEKLPLREELTGKTVGIVGLGHIGKEVAKRLLGFQANVLYHDIVKMPRDVERQLHVRRVTLEEMLPVVDILTLHVPLTRLTRKMIGEPELRKMKPTAILINACRGGVVDEKALYRALQEGWIAGAGLDVLEQEPTPADNPLLDLDRVVVTPHWAGGTRQSLERSTTFAMENFLRLARAQEPQSLVTPEE
jgi:phosphoglycerate dehydrogenase-like enzyme